MPSYILIATISVSILSIYLSLRAGLFFMMDRYIRWFLGYLALHATHAWLVRAFFADNMRLDYLAPYGLLYGPFLYFAYRMADGRPLTRQQAWPHALPFLVFLAGYVVWLSDPSLFAAQPRLLGLCLYTVLPLSFFSYAIWALFFQSVRTGVQRNEAVRMISAMAIILAFIAVVFSVFIYSSIGSYQFRSEFKGSVVFITMLSAAIMSFSHIVKRIVGRSDGQDETHLAEVTATQQPVPESAAGEASAERYQKSAIPADLLVAYEASLRQLVESKCVYLDDGLSLASLAQQLKIPKHHLSQVFSQRIGKNFSTYINEQRVNHAITLMHTHPEMGIAEIFTASGFTAKASFNRYFRQFQGCTPSEYRNRMAK